MEGRLTAWAADIVLLYLNMYIGNQLGEIIVCREIYMGKFTFDEINSMYFDVLREIGNIGAGNATTAVATLLNVKLNMEVPNVKLMAVQELNTAIGSEEEEIVGVYLGVQNDIEGSLMFLLKMDAAHYLVNRLLGRTV